jgi:hypothetical protein
MLRGERIAAPIASDYPFDEIAVFRQRGFPKMHFVENKYCGDRTNWWIPNNPCLEAMLRSAGLKILEQPEAEVYLCSPSCSDIHPVPHIFVRNDDSNKALPQTAEREATA